MGNKIYIEKHFDGVKYSATSINQSWDNIPLWAETNELSMIGKNAISGITNKPSIVKSYNKCIMVKRITGEFVEFSPNHDMVILQNGDVGHAQYFKFN